MPRAFLAALIARIIGAAEPVAVFELQRGVLTAPCVEGRASTQVSPSFASSSRWVRLIDGSAPVRVNGTLVPEAVSGIALSPYLRGKGQNSVEYGCRPDQAAAIETTPRVFLRQPRLSKNKVVVVAANTLENAVGVAVEIGSQRRDAYIPPESEVEVEFLEVAAGLAMVRMTKLPEALEGGYEFRMMVRVP